MFHRFGSRFINLGNVRSIDWLDDDEFLMVTYTNGDQEKIMLLGEKVEDVIAPVIPAAPGFSVIRVWLPWREGPIRKDVMNEGPVVAWRMTEDGPKAITFHAIAPTDDTMEAVLGPDGSVIEPGSGLWSNIDEWLDHVRCEQKARLLSRKANP